MSEQRRNSIQRRIANTLTGRRREVLIETVAAAQIEVLLLVEDPIMIVIEVGIEVVTETMIDIREETSTIQEIEEETRDLDEMIVDRGEHEAAVVIKRDATTKIVTIALGMIQGKDIEEEAGLNPEKDTEIIAKDLVSTLTLTVMMTEEGKKRIEKIDLANIREERVRALLLLLTNIKEKRSPAEKKKRSNGWILLKRKTSRKLFQKYKSQQCKF